MTTTGLSDWMPAALPEPCVLSGRYARLEPLDAARHTADLFAAASAPGAEDRFRFLFDMPPATEADMHAWIVRAGGTRDPLFFAVIDQATGRAGGRQALMRIDAPNGVVEIGHVLWGPAVARSRIATEALFLCADHVFGRGYRRLEWKCDNENLPSRRAAARFGFQAEGLFRQHMVCKGRNRDTAWFSILDRDWPRLAAGYRQWLSPENFDAEGRQRARLAF